MSKNKESSPTASATFEGHTEVDVDALLKRPRVQETLRNVIGRVEQMDRAGKLVNARVKELERQVKRLRERVWHSENCNVNRMRGNEPTGCNCGLDELMAETEPKP